MKEEHLGRNQNSKSQGPILEARRWSVSPKEKSMEIMYLPLLPVLRSEMMTLCGGISSEV